MQSSYGAAGGDQFLTDTWRAFTVVGCSFYWRRETVGWHEGGCMKAEVVGSLDFHSEIRRSVEHTDII